MDLALAIHKINPAATYRLKPALKNLLKAMRQTWGRAARHDCLYTELLFW